jgi:hypothetical protein
MKFTNRLPAIRQKVKQETKNFEYSMQHVKYERWVFGQNLFSVLLFNIQYSALNN